MSGASQLPGRAETTTDPLSLGLPRLCWGTRSDQALRELKAAGIRPVLLRGTTAELAWDGRFGSAMGRATLGFDAGDRLEEIALVLPVAGTGEQLFEPWSHRLSALLATPPRQSAGVGERVRIWEVGGDPVASLRWLPRSEPPILELRWLRPHRSPRSCPW